MRFDRKARSRAVAAGVGLGAVAVVLGTAAAVGTLTSAKYAPPVSEKVASYYSNPPTVTAAPKPLNKISPDLLKPGTKALFFGDSWTAGYAAQPPSGGMVYVAGRELGWDFRVHGGSGTGYLNPGNGMGNYAARIGTLDPDPAIQVFVLQGGLNDAEKDLTKLPAAIDAALAAAHEKFPNAQVILLGPVNAGVSSGPLLRSVSGAIYLAAARHQLPFISPVDDLWITAPNYKDIIDVTAVNHPGTAGHAYLGDRITKAIRSLAAS